MFVTVLKRAACFHRQIFLWVFCWRHGTLGLRFYSLLVEPCRWKLPCECSHCVRRPPSDSFLRLVYFLSAFLADGEKTPFQVSILRYFNCSHLPCPWWVAHTRLLERWLASLGWNTRPCRIWSFQQGFKYLFPFHTHLRFPWRYYLMGMPHADVTTCMSWSLGRMLGEEAWGRAWRPSPLRRLADSRRRDARAYYDTDMKLPR